MSWIAFGIGAIVGTGILLLAWAFWAKTDYRKIILAVLLAPFVTVPVTVVELCAIHRVHDVREFLFVLMMSLSICCEVSLPAAYLAELLFGLPIRYILQRHEIHSSYAYGACGAAIGVTAEWLWSVFSYNIKVLEYMLRLWSVLPMLTAAVSGSLAALIFRSLTLQLLPTKRDN